MYKTRFFNLALLAIVGITDLVTGDPCGERGEASDDDGWPRNAAEPPAKVADYPSPHLPNFEPARIPLPLMSR